MSACLFSDSLTDLGEGTMIFLFTHYQSIEQGAIDNKSKISGNTNPPTQDRRSQIHHLYLLIHLRSHLSPPSLVRKEKNSSQSDFRCDHTPRSPGLGIHARGSGTLHPDQPTAVHMGCPTYLQASGPDWREHPCSHLRGTAVHPES